MNGKVVVVKREHEDKFRLRVILDTPDAGQVFLETGPEFSKAEADYRVMALSRTYGLKCDELPTKHERLPGSKQDDGGGDD